MKLTDNNILQANINRTKQYVRDYGGKVSTLPTATSSNVGQIYQYIGSTTSTYTHGYFYECKQNGSTYSWVNVPVGEGSGGGHTILNGSGSAMTQRSKLQFEGMYVTDDSTNDKTKVSIPQFTQAGWDALSSTDKAKYNGCQVIIKDDYGVGKTLVWSQTGVSATTDYNSLNISVSAYSKLRLQIYSRTNLYGGEIANVCDAIVDIADVTEKIGANNYYAISRHFASPDGGQCVVYFYKNAKTTIAKVTIYKLGSASDRTIDFYIYGIK